MRWRRAIAALAIVAIGGGACFSEHGNPAGPGGDCDFPIPRVAGTTVVFIRDFRFEPEEVRVARGTQVSWINCGPLEGHTSTSSVAGTWDSGLLAPGEFYTRRFDDEGEYDYFCAPHPFMEGRVTVE